MTWSTSNCIDYYTVTVSNGSSVVVQTHTTNLTSILINGLQQRMNYSFTVKAVDGIGREGNTSEYVTLLLDGMKNITVGNFKLLLFYYSSTVYC